MFALSDFDLSRRILDCAGGAASFTAEARASGYTVYAVDPLYGLSQTERIEVVEAGYNRAIQNISKERDLYQWGFPSSPEEHRALRRNSADIFLESILKNPEYYIPGRLESLPFQDDSFDIVLCSHFLFTYANILNEVTHVRYLREMLRVAKMQVRIYPIIGYGVDATSSLNAVCSECSNLGFVSSIRNVPYHFLKGTGQMLEINKSFTIH